MQNFILFMIVVTIEVGTPFIAIFQFFDTIMECLLHRLSIVYYLLISSRILMRVTHAYLRFNGFLTWDFFFKYL